MSGASGVGGAGGVLAGAGGALAGGPSGGFGGLAGGPGGFGGVGGPPVGGTGGGAVGGTGPGGEGGTGGTIPTNGGTGVGGTGVGGTGVGGTGPVGGTGGATMCPVINVTRATYAANCNTPFDMTQYMQFACNALTSCTYVIQPPLDPAFGCPKNFTYEFQCYAPGRPPSVFSQEIPPPVEGTSTFLFCSCANMPD
jgi:hypothetical protein